MTEREKEASEISWGAEYELDDRIVLPVKGETMAPKRPGLEEGVVQLLKHNGVYYGFASVEWFLDNAVKRHAPPPPKPAFFTNTAAEQRIPFTYNHNNNNNTAYVAPF